MDFICFIKRLFSIVFFFLRPMSLRTQCFSLIRLSIFLRQCCRRFSHSLHCTLPFYRFTIHVRIYCRARSTIDWIRGFFFSLYFLPLLCSSKVEYRRYSHLFTNKMLLNRCCGWMCWWEWQYTNEMLVKNARARFFAKPNEMENNFFFFVTK